MITIIDYGMGNVGSIRNMLLKVGVDSIVRQLHPEHLPGCCALLDGRAVLQAERWRGGVAFASVGVGEPAL